MILLQIIKEILKLTKDIMKIFLCFVNKIFNKVKNFG